MKPLHLLFASVLLAPSLLAQQHEPTIYRYDDERAGTALTVEDFGSVVYWNLDQLSGRIDVGGVTGSAKNGVSEMNWEHQNTVTGVIQGISVRVEKLNGQTVAQHQKKFKDAVDLMLGLYPANVPTSAPLMGQIRFRQGPGSEGSSLPVYNGPPSNGDIMSMSWEWDPDGSGPSFPLTVTISTERRSGESSSQQSRRLNKMVQTALKDFPSNVPKGAYIETPWRLKAA